jgi:flavin-dependent dehydrogenase
METFKTEICILGGGLAGLTLGLQLKQRSPELEIIILEKRKGPAPEAAFKVGESTVEIGAHYFAEILNLKSHLKEAHLPKFGLRYFFQKDDNSDISTRLECGAGEFLPTPSYQIDRGIFENHLSDTCRTLGITLLDDTKVDQVDLPQSSVAGKVLATHDNSKIEISADWIVDASGRSSLLKRQLKLQEEVQHKCSSAWFRVEGRIKIDNWNDDPTWHERIKESSRWLSTNHLMGKGYWVWLIPLGSGHTSVGIVADSELHPLSTYNSIEKAMEWLKQQEPECAKHIQGDIMDFIAYKNFSYNCKTVFSEDRWALSGEAGLFLDPFYSPGSDYIAISNTLISELIHMERSGKSIAAYTRLYDHIYHQLFDIHLSLYEGQYHFFGDGKVMVPKIIWDFSYYWCIPATLFFQNKITDPHLFAQFQAQLSEANDLNLKVQQTFRNWNQADNSEAPSNFVNLPKVTFMRQLNTELQDQLDEKQFQERLNNNLTFLKELAEEIVSSDHSDIQHLKHVYKLVGQTQAVNFAH